VDPRYEGTMTTKPRAPKAKKTAASTPKKPPSSKPATNPFLKEHPNNPWRSSRGSAHR
jgi:hypothetical protein